MGQKNNSTQFNMYLLICRLTSTWANCKDRTETQIQKQSNANNYKNQTLNRGNNNKKYKKIKLN